MANRSKLAVIVHADVVGSTGLVQADEHVAHDLMQQTFRHLSEVITTYAGITHEVRGDALVGEFERASDAASACLAFQLANAERNRARGSGMRPQVRIGIALGEVVIADSTVTGAGVVLAQRLEQLASADGVCISAAVREALPGRLPFAYHSLGEQTLKGFDEPQRVYRVEPGPGDQVPPPEPAGTGASRRGRKPSLIRNVVILVCVLIAGSIVGRFALPPDTEQAEQESPEGTQMSSSSIANAPSGTQAGPEVEVTPSIAVLAFDNLSTDPEQEYFADGIALDLITDLSKVAGLLVISRDSSFSFKGKGVPAKEVARQLGVAYVLSGSVRRAGDKLRLNVELTKAATDSSAWAERFDGSAKDVFAFQDQVVRVVTGAVSESLAPPDSKAVDTRPDNLAAYDEFLRGWTLRARRNADDSHTAVKHFQRALELEPGYERATVGLALTLWEATDYGVLDRQLRYSSPRAEAWELLRPLLSSENPEVLSLHASMLAGARRPEEAVRTAKRVLELDDSNVQAMRTLAWVYAMSGQDEAALRFAERSLQVDPLTPWAAHAVRGLVAFQAGDYAGATERFKEALSGGADIISWQVLLAASLASTGDREAGRQVLEAALGKLEFPGEVSVGDFMGSTFLPIADRSLADRIAASLGAMGLPGADSYVRTSTLR